jgi:two-component system OmpR family sensor kinase
VADLPRMLLVVTALVLVVAAGRIPMVRQVWSLGEVTQMLALVSVAVGTLSAVSIGVLGQLTNDARGLWIGAGVLLYSLIGIPAATLSAQVPQEDATIGNVRLLAHVMFVVLTFAAVFAAARPGGDGWTVLFLGILLTAGVVGAGLAFPQGSLAITTNPVVRSGVCVAWVLSGLCVVLTSWLRNASWLFWVGMGCTVIAVAHAFRVAAGSPDAPLGLSFSTVRLFGVILLLIGTAGATRHALLAVHAAYSMYQEEVRLARIDLDEVEQRAHDVRNGLAGLAGVTVLLEAGVRDHEEMATLREAVAAELVRLDALLRPPGSDGDLSSPEEYAVEPVLNQQVALQSSNGVDIRLDVDLGLAAIGRPAILTQVMTNLLANCAQHAAGSPIRVQARRVQDRVEIRVRDFGPGLPPGLAGTVFNMRERGRFSTGQGLGLHICRKLLAAEKGKIEMRCEPPSLSGCTVLIELPGPERPEEPAGSLPSSVDKAELALAAGQADRVGAGAAR